MLVYPSLLPPCLIYESQALTVMAKYLSAETYRSLMISNVEEISYIVQSLLVYINPVDLFLIFVVLPQMDILLSYMLILPCISPCSNLLLFFILFLM